MPRRQRSFGPAKLAVVEGWNAAEGKYSLALGEEGDGPKVEAEAEHISLVEAEAGGGGGGANQNLSDRLKGFFDA